MLRSLRSLCALAFLGLGAASGTACFGIVEYDVVPHAGGTLDSAVGGTGAGGTFSQPSSVGGRSAGSGGARVLPEPQVPNCTVDCCPSELSQLTRSLDGGPLSADAERPYVSADGTWVAFGSRATNLSGLPASGQREVFLRSLADDGLVVVRPPSGEPPSGDSEAAALSADGRWVLLTSQAQNFALGDENGAGDVFLFDRVSSELVLVSRTASGAAGNGASLARDLSSDGRYVVYSSAASDLTVGDDNGGWDVFVWDRQNNVTERVSMGPGDQQSNPVPGNHAHISADGRYVSFHSQSDLLVPGDDEDTFDIFLSDRQLGTTIKVSRTPSGGDTDGNAFVLGMSEDARYLSSYASATNLVPADTNAQSDVFLFDRALGSVTRVNLGPGGEEADMGSNSAALSQNGRFLSFTSAATRLSPAANGSSLQSYVYDSSEGRVKRLSESVLQTPGDADSQVAELSGSGRCYVFSSAASNLTPDSTADFVMDLFIGRMQTGPR